jgi:hypothetical protein
MNQVLSPSDSLPGDMPPPRLHALRLHWLLFSVWLVGSLIALGAFEYRDAVRGLLCRG